MDYTDYKAVRNLNVNLLKNMSAISSRTIELSETLKQLQSSWNEDGIDSVNENVNAIIGQIGSSSESFFKVSADLSTYADLLAQGK